MHPEDPKNIVTTNMCKITIYSYLADSFQYTYKLANDLVVGIKPEADEVVFLIPDDNDVYDLITSVTSQKPTKKHAVFYTSPNHLWKTTTIENGKELINKLHDPAENYEYKLEYFLRSRRNITD